MKTIQKTTEKRGMFSASVCSVGKLSLLLLPATKGRGPSVRWCWQRERWMRLSAADMCLRRAHLIQVQKGTLKPIPQHSRRRTGTQILLKIGSYPRSFATQSSCVTASLASGRRGTVSSNFLFTGFQYLIYLATDAHRKFPTFKL